MRERIYWICAVVIFVIALVVVCAVGYKAFSAYSSIGLVVDGGQIANKMEHLGQAGDFFGGVLNPIVSVLALVALLAGLGLQSKQVDDARADADAARAEAKAQTALAHRQSFETVYFNLLNMHARSLDQVQFVQGETELRGASALAAHAEYNDISIPYNNWDVLPSSPVIFGEFNSRGLRFMARSSQAVSSYSGVVEQILAFVDGYPLENAADKSRYFDIYRSLITPQEGKALLLVCLSKPSSRLSDLIIRHNVASCLDGEPGYVEAKGALEFFRRNP